VKGLMNVQYALKDDVVYVLEVNPRSSRTVPFISKATGVPLAWIAAQVAATRQTITTRYHGRQKRRVKATTSSAAERSPARLMRKPMRPTTI